MIARAFHVVGNSVKWFNPVRWTKRYRRVASTLDAFLAERERNNPTDVVNDVYKRAETVLNSAMVSVDHVWKLIHLAQRLDIICQPVHSIPASATVLRREADKINLWRKNAVYDLLGSPEKPKEDEKLTSSSVHVAAFLIYEHYDNQAYKDRLLESHAWRLFIVLAFTVLALFWWFHVITIPVWWFGFKQVRWLESPFVNPDPFGTLFKEAYTAQTLVPVALFGLLGAIISAIIKFPNSSQASRIPEIAASLSITLLRIFMGGAAAIVVYIFLGSSLARNIFTFANTDSITISTIFAVSIVAGFSERLVMRAVEALSDPKKESSQK